MFPWHQNFNYNCQGLNPYDCSCLRRTRRPTRTSRSRWKMMWRHQRRQLDLNLKFVGSPWGTVIKVYILLWFLSSCMSYSILEKCWQTWGWSQMMMIIKLPSTIIYVFVVGHDTWDPKPLKNTGTSSCPKVHICAFAQYAQEASSGAAAALEDSKYKGDLNVRLGTSCSQGCANNLNLMRNTIVQVAACGFSLPPTLRWWCGLPGKLSRLSYQKGLQVGRVESA